MASKVFICDAFRKYIMDGTIDLNTDTLKAALVTSSEVTSYTAWQAATAYTVGDIRVPVTDNGRRYRCKTSGTSHATTEPTWPTIDGAEVTDGTVTWEEYGGALANLAVWADASDHEVSSGDGYTTGGAALAGNAITYSGDEATWDFNDISWSTLTKTMRYAFLYKEGVANGVTNPLIAYILLDATPTDISVVSVDFLINLSVLGFLVLN